jgi:hypothetical protein
LWFRFPDLAKQLPATGAMGQGKMRIIFRSAGGWRVILLVAGFQHTEG